MGFLTSQIFLYMLIAALIGGVIGWILKSFFCGNCEEEISQWRTKYKDLENRNSSLEAAAGANSKNEGEVSSLRAKVSGLEETNGLQADRIADLEGRLTDGSSENEADAELAAENKKLKSDLAACAKKSSDLEASLAAASAAAATTKAPEPKAAPAPKAAAPAKKTSKKEVFTTDAPAPKGLLKKADGKKDDLKEIWGVGPVMEGVMNKLGIFHFRQVAELSDRDVEWVSANIGTFPDRVKRDKWVSQAGELHKKHHG